MKRKYSVIEWTLKHTIIVLLLITSMVLFGIIAIIEMPRQEFPGYTIRQGVIIGVFPGATTEEVEKQLAEPLEEFLFSYPEVKRSFTTTTSKNGICYAMVELNDNVRNKDEVWSKIKHGLTSLKMQLPSGVVRLVVRDDFGDTSALLISIGSDNRSYREIKDYSDELIRKLRRIESVSSLRLSGMKEEQIAIYADRNKIASYGLSEKLFLAEIFGQSLAPGGKISNDDVLVPVHFTPAYSNVREVEEQVIFSDPGGNMIRIRDVARVEREFSEEGSDITYNGHPCLVLSVEMKEGFNIWKFGKDVNNTIEQFKKGSLPDDVIINRITDQADVVNSSVNSFLRDLLIAIIVIIVVMMILFPFRSALVAAIVIPLNTFISIGIMYLFGIPLNTVTLAALVVVLGMTVDNSIVIIDGYLYFLKSGLKPADAAIESAHKYFMPMFLATLCICLIFYPLLILFKGQMQEFIYFFPFTFTINMMLSLVLAVTLVPILEVALIKPVIGNADQREKKRTTEKVHDVYLKLLAWNFRHPWFTVSAGVISILISLVIIPRIKFRMNPVAERDQFAVEINLPDGTPLAKTREVADSMRGILLKDPRVKSVTQFTGMSSPRFHISYAPKMPLENYAQFIVNTGSHKETEAVLDEYTDTCAHYFRNAYVKFKQIDFQHVPSFEFRFFGENSEDLKETAATLMAELNKLPELTNIRTDWGAKLPVLDIEMDPVASSRLGVTRAVAAFNLMLSTSKFTIGSLTENNGIIPVVIKTDDAHSKVTLEKFPDTYVATILPSVSIPLRQIAKVSPRWSENGIVHRNGIKTISVLADTKRSVLPARLLSKVQDYIENDLVPGLPEGIYYEVGGEPEYNRENLSPVIEAIIAAFAIIFIFFLFIYGKFRLTFISLFTLFLFMFGAVAGLWIGDYTVGITTALGLIGLFGLTVRNVILMFQHAEQKFVVEGWPAKEAAFDAGKRRMIPIFLTSAAASVGVIPMIISGSSFWAPVGIVIFAGGIFLLLMTITILPVLYWKSNEKKNQTQDSQAGTSI